MALLFIDGFDHVGTGDPAALGKWASATGAACVGTPRTGTGSLRLSFATGALLESKALPASGGVVVGAAFYFAGFLASDLVQVREGATVHLAVGLTTGGLLTVKRGTTVLLTGTTVLVINNWYYLELKAVIDDVAGAYELRINTVPELSASGVDTRNVGTTGQWDRIRLGWASSTVQPFIDDLYVCDTSGAAPRNTFLGPCKVETLLPQTGNGTHVGLTPSTGTDHGALVDENPPNATDFNGSPTVGAKDTYHYPSLALTGTLLGVQTNLYVNKSDAAVRQVCAVMRSGGVDYDGANVAPATTFSYFSEMRALNPNTGTDWTSATVAALEAGMKVTA